MASMVMNRASWLECAARLSPAPATGATGYAIVSDDPRQQDAPHAEEAWYRSVGRGLSRRESLRPMPRRFAGPRRLWPARASRRFVLTVAGLLLVGLVALLLSLSVGSAGFGPAALWQVVQGDGSPLARAVIVELRLPRALAAFAAGGLLAYAGALMQVLLRNPLADPYVLGVSGGAAVGALSAMLLGLSAWVSPAAFVGALLSTALVFSLAGAAGRWSSTRLLLTGVVLAAGWGAVITFLLATAPNSELPGMLFWLMGDLSAARGSIGALAVLAVLMLAALPFGRSLNVLGRGALQAAALGVPVIRLELAIHLCSALATAVAVSVAGSIGFVGLIVPHMLRLVIGNDQRLLVPASALFGGALLTLADTVARTLLAPEQLPVGVITAMVGVPAFLLLLHRSGLGR